MKTEYKTEVYNATKGFLYIYVFFMSTMVLLISIGILLKNSFVSVTGFICFCILPFVFEKRIKLLFTKRVLLKFDDLSFSITQYHLKNDIVLKQMNFIWNNIKSYKVYFSPTKNTILTLYLRNGTSKSWGFKDNKTFQEAISGESLFNIFHSYIKQYNINKNSHEKIALNMGFFNSKAGTILLYSEIGIIIFGFIFHLIMHPQSSILTLLVGFSLVIQQFFKRKQEKVLYNNICKMD